MASPAVAPKTRKCIKFEPGQPEAENSRVVFWLKFQLKQKGQIKSEHIPHVVFELVNMISLDLKYTKINTIPDNNLTSLTELNLDNNYIHTITENTMKSLINIKILTISNNFLKEIPSEINILLSLEVLDLSFNTISNIKKIKKILIF